MPSSPPALAPAPDASDPRFLAYLNLKLREIGQPGRRPGRRRGAFAVCGAFSGRQPREGPRAGQPCLPGRPPDPELSLRLPGRGAPPADLDARPGSAGPGPGAVAAAPARRAPQPRSCPPTGSTRACCTTRAATAAPPRASSTSPRAGCRSPTTRRRCRAAVFGRLLDRALHPPPALLRLPFTAAEPRPGRVLRLPATCAPWSCPEVPGLQPAQAMEIRFFAPGALVANLDFVESIFGNAGDPDLPENDAGARSRALDRPHRLRHPGPAPERPDQEGARAAALGGRHRRASAATACAGRIRPKRTTTASPFKLTARDASGVIVTLISDNYFGYCKKEVKTQISFAANLFGRAEEEHAGGAIVFPSYDLGEEFQLSSYVPASAIRSPRRWPSSGTAPSFSPAAGRATASTRISCTCPQDARFDLPTPAHRLEGRGRSRADAQAPARPHLRPALGLQGRDGQARRGPPLAPARHDRRGAALPQALHGLRRRQVGDLQVDRRRDVHRPGVRQRPGPGPRAGRRDPPPRLRRPLPGSGPGQAPRPARPPPRALARIGRQAPQPQPGLHRRLQRLARLHPAVHPRPGAARQAAATSRNGATTGARQFTRRHRSTAGPATS